MTARGKRTSKAAAPRRERRDKPGSVTEYMAALAPATAEALERLRALIHEAAPGAEECISYDLPAFRLDGRIVAWIGGAARHIAMYGVSGLTAAEVEAYDTSGKGTLRFPLDAPLPVALVRRLVAERIARTGSKG